jgi:hypothetical protein
MQCDHTMCPNPMNPIVDWLRIFMKPLERNLRLVSISFFLNCHFFIYQQVTLLSLPRSISVCEINLFCSRSLKFQPMFGRDPKYCRAHKLSSFSPQSARCFNRKKENRTSIRLLNVVGSFQIANFFPHFLPFCEPFYTASSR